jgi:hypothetical protein
LARDTGGEVQRTESERYSKEFLKSGDGSWRWMLSLPIATDNWYLKKRGVSNELIDAADIHGNDNMIVFPFTVNGGCQTRFTKSKKYRFWGSADKWWPFQLDFARNKDKVFITEGVFGALRGLDAGYLTVASLGSGSFHHVARACNAKPAYAMADDDPAGRMAMAKCLAYGVPFAKIRGLEPDELTHGQWRHIANNTKEYFSYSLSDLLSRVDYVERKKLRRAYEEERRKKSKSKSY